VPVSTLDTLRQLLSKNSWVAAADDSSWFAPRLKTLTISPNVAKEIPPHIQLRHAHIQVGHVRALLLSGENRTLNREGTAAALQKLNMHTSDSDLDTLFHWLDADSSGEVDWEVSMN
jgi:hypothetical protein